MRDKDIKYLQIILNLDNDTKIKDKGLGSFTNETEYFGVFTKQAVIKFQEKYKEDILKPINKDKGIGIVETMTIMKLNEILDEITRQKYDKYLIKEEAKESIRRIKNIRR